KVTTVLLPTSLNFANECQRWDQFPAVMIAYRATALLALVTMPLLLARGLFAFLLRDIRLARKALTFYEAMWALPRVLFWLLVIDVLEIHGVLVANDHSPNFVTLVRAARILGIPSFYVQHAHVTKK